MALLSDIKICLDICRGFCYRPNDTDPVNGPIVSEPHYLSSTDFHRSAEIMIYTNGCEVANPR